MKHWSEIEGWFTMYDQAAYAWILDRLPNPARFLEIGAYKGRSTNCMDQLAKQAKKDVTIDIVDTFAGDSHMGVKDTYLEFLKNTKECNIGTVYVGNSKETHVHVGLYDAIFIDACHDTEPVIADISNYLPRLKQHGIIAGHDIHHFSVAPAVEKVFGDNYFVIGNCWINPDPFRHEP